MEIQRVKPDIWDVIHRSGELSLVSASLRVGLVRSVWHSVDDAVGLEQPLYDAVKPERYPE